MLEIIATIFIIMFGSMLISVMPAIVIMVWSLAVDELREITKRKSKES